MDEKEKNLSTVVTDESVAEAPEGEMSPVQESVEVATEITSESISENGNSDASGNEIAEDVQGGMNEQPEKRCINCMAVLKPEDICCPECGAMQEKICPNCSNRMSPEQSFCTACGASLANAQPGFAARGNSAGTVQTKKANNNVKIIAVIAVVLVAVIAFFVINSQNEKKRIEEFNSNAQKFEEYAMDYVVNLEEIGDEILTNWNDYVYNRWTIYDNPDDVLDSTLDDMYYEVEKAEEDRTEIERIYSNLKAPKNEEKYTELVSRANDLYDVYMEFYEFVTDPGGSYNSYKSEYRQLKDDFLDAYTAYSECLESLN